MVLVPVGATRDVGFIADVPGDWTFHCHKSHHTMNHLMGHDAPNPFGANPKALEEKVQVKAG
jgi:FtsP/CotA-like multicopper oxidase with cupredoxin domain